MQTSSEKFKLAHRSYAEALRFIGQTLVKLRPELLEIELSNDVYKIRGRSHEPIHQAASHKSLPPSLGENPSDAKQPLPQAFTFQYAADDIVKLSKEWKAKRHEIGKMPDIHGLAELLRTIGSDLDGSGRSLLKITREGLRLVVLFQERDGNSGTREYDLLFLSKKQKEIASDRLRRAGVEPWKDWDH